MVYLKYVENVIPLSKLIGLLFLFCLPLLSILFLKTKRNDLARPVMGTIFLVIPVQRVRWLARAVMSLVMYSDDSVTFDLCFMRTLTFDSSFLYFDPMYENERNLVETVSVSMI